MRKLQAKVLAFQRFILLGCLLSLMAGLGWSSNGRAAIYQVGPTRACQSIGNLPALRPGDVVEVDSGIYHEVKRWTDSGAAGQPILIRGVGASRPVFDAAGQAVDGVRPRPRAIFQIEADYLVLENLEFKNARNGHNGAGLRVTGAHHVTVRQCKITRCDMGVMSDRTDQLLIESCEIAFNGAPAFDGYSHNLYLGGNHTTVRFCSIHDALHGQNFKSRGHYTELLYNYIAGSQDGEIGLVDAKETALANSHALMIGNVVLSKPRQSGYNSGRFIQFGQDQGGPHQGTLFVFNNTLLAGDGRIQFLSANADGARIVAHNNIFFGSDRIIGAQGGGVSGSHNWMMSSATVPASFSATLQGNDPGFIDRLAGNYHLTATSPCRNRGIMEVIYLDGAGLSHPGRPVSEYVYPCQSRPRPQDSQIDLGAYELGGPTDYRPQAQGAD